MATPPTARDTLYGRLTRRSVCILWACFSFVGLGFAELQIHQMEAGETLEQLAQTYLGGTEFVGELRRYNGFTPDELQAEGSLIAIPGPLRAEALGKLGQAALALDQAVEAQAGQYARVEFANATRTEAAAREAMADAVYCQAVALSELAIVRSQTARRVADENARVPRNAIIVAVSGRAEYSTDDPSTWREARASIAVPPKSDLRTGPGSRVALRLDDGSTLTLGEHAILTFRDYIKDLRTGEVQALIAVPRGGIEGAFAANPGPTSRTVLQSGSAVNVLNGAAVRVRVDAEEISRTEVLSGQAEVRFGEQRVVVQKGEGSLLDAGRKTLFKVELLPAPEVAARFGTALTTARQIVELSWSALAGEVPGYRVDVARDAGFVDVIETAAVGGNLHETSVLAEGAYDWRVCGVDRYGIQGYASAPSRLTVAKNLLIDIEYDGPMTQQGERTITGGETRLRPVTRTEPSSVVRYEYSVNGSPFRRMRDGIPLPRDGRYEVRVRGVAADNDVGPESSLVAWVDATGPRVTLDVSPPFDDPHRRRMVTAELTATDETGLDRIEVALGNASFTPYEGPITLPAMKEHLVRFRAWDLLGNASPAMSFRVRGDRGS